MMINVSNDIKTSKCHLLEFQGFFSNNKLSQTVKNFKKKDFTH